MTVEASVVALSGYDVPNAQATAFTVGVNVLRFRIDHAVVVNYSAAPVDFSLYLLQSGDTVIDLNLRYDLLSIPAGETVTLFDIIGEVLDTGGIINAFAGAVTSLALSVSGTNFK